MLKSAPHSFKEQSRVSMESSKDKPNDAAKSASPDEKTEGLNQAPKEPTRESKELTRQPKEPTRELKEPKEQHRQRVKKKKKKKTSKDHLKDTIKFCIFSALCTIILRNLCYLCTIVS